MQNGPKYTCEFCTIKKKTKDSFIRHVSLCKFIHTSSKEHTMNQDLYEAIPSQQILLQYVLDLTEKCEQLEQKMDKIYKTSYQQKRKNFNEYLDTLNHTGISYTNWLKSLVITDIHLDILFKNDLRECIKAVLTTSIESGPIPFKAFIQRQHGLYIYTEVEEGSQLYKWRLATADEFKKIILILSQRVMRKFTEWQLENETEIAISERLRELQNLYMHKANGGNSSLESRSTDIRKWFVSRIQTSLKNID